MPSWHRPKSSRPPAPAARSLRSTLLLVPLVAAAISARAGDLTDQSLENLLDAEVSGAGFARQVSAATSAVSVLTSEDIRVLGLRTLGEVLDQMRGLHVSHSADYVFLGARGLGGPQSLAGRVLLLVDGIPAVDNLFDQIYLGHDGVIDVALIERIEYAPGSGSALYGNNAFLGVINVVTRRGRDIDGVQASAGFSDWGDRSWRLTAGCRHENGPEWLVSATAHRNSGLPSDEIGDLYSHSSADDLHLFAKGRWEGFSLEAWSAQRLMKTVDAPSYGRSHIDRNQVLALGHDGRPAAGWRSSLRLMYGSYDFGYHEHETTIPYQFDQADHGDWWALEGQLAYDGWTDHKAVVGVRLRRDPLLRHDAVLSLPQDLAGEDKADDGRRSVGLSVQDEYTLSGACRVIGGLRVDRPDFSHTAWSPLGALACEPLPGWSIKLSEGRATRLASVAESDWGRDPQATADERVTTQELVSEYKHDDLRLLGSAYRYRVSGIFRAPDATRTDGFTGTDGHGFELEAEWLWEGWRLRGSQAWQFADATDGSRLGFSPRTVTKLQLSAPLHGDALRASLTARRVGDFFDNGLYDFSTGQYDVTPQRVPARTLVDLTLSSHGWLAGLDVRLGVRNLLQQREVALDSEFGYQPPTGRRQRTAWIEFTGTFR